MPKALAIHTIHIGREPGTVSELTGNITKPALVDEYKPGDIIFECADKQFAELEKLGAVREATTVDEAKATARGYVDPAVARAAQAGETIAVKQPEPPKKPEGDAKPADNLLG
ncbi:hypothetical protein [Bradyrhizobium sp. WSM3983]|uniref:hypothetical protein n=1 Tax=Bradyrhizobium sp. WSM3983 TaxID=1038867 RepID=UPI0003F7A7B4|nr:hypothetical protein [Bradyrhizobium sp. WSM3983]